MSMCLISESQTAPPPFFINKRLLTFARPIGKTTGPIFIFDFPGQAIILLEPNYQANQLAGIFKTNRVLIRETETGRIFFIEQTINQREIQFNLNLSCCYCKLYKMTNKN